MNLEVFQGTWQRPAQMFEGGRRLKHPRPLPVNSKEEKQSFQHSPLLIRAVNRCREGGLTALLCAGSEGAPPSAAAPSICRSRLGLPSTDPSRSLDQGSLNSGAGGAVQCLTADTRAWPLSTTHEGREPTGEHKVIPTG